MDINEIKQVPIVDFLYIVGIEPVKHKASGLWYHAPYRNDRKSFASGINGQECLV